MLLRYHAMKYRIITVRNINTNCLNPAYRSFLYSVADDTAALRLLWGDEEGRVPSPYVQWRTGRAERSQTDLLAVHLAGRPSIFYHRSVVGW